MSDEKVKKAYYELDPFRFDQYLWVVDVQITANLVNVIREIGKLLLKRQTEETFLYVEFTFCRFSERTFWFYGDWCTYCSTH